MQTETTERIEIADARLEADGERVSLDLHAMDCTTTTDYEVGPLPGERTAGTKRRSANLEWNSTRTWDLLAKMHGGEQRLMDREFSLVVTEAGDEILDGEDAPEPRTFRQVRFHGRDRISYLSEG